MRTPSMVRCGNPAQAARILWRLCYTGDLATVQARIDVDDARSAIDAALAQNENVVGAAVR